MFCLTGSLLYVIVPFYPKTVFGFGTVCHITSLLHQKYHKMTYLVTDMIQNAISVHEFTTFSSSLKTRLFSPVNRSEPAITCVLALHIEYCPQVIAGSLRFTGENKLK